MAEPQALQTPALPQSSALSEAKHDSLSELMSRDPEGYQQQDLDRIIEALRAKRAAWQAGEAEKEGKPKRKSAAEMLAKTAAKPEDLGL